MGNGATVKFEVTQTGREDASFDAKQFQPVADAILRWKGYANEGVVQMSATPIQKARPKKATVKFGMELAIESGQLTAVARQRLWQSQPRNHPGIGAIGQG
ncbi:MAG: CU044_2847 family protein [Nodosilinea sp.]